MKKILVVCGNGLGSSFIVEMNLKTILKELGLEAEVSHTDLTTSKTEEADFYLGAADLVVALEDGKRNIIKINNIMSKEELRTAVETHIKGA